MLLNLELCKQTAKTLISCQLQDTASSNFHERNYFTIPATMLPSLPIGLWTPPPPERSKLLEGGVKKRKVALRQTNTKNVSPLEIWKVLSFGKFITPLLPCDS